MLDQGAADADVENERVLVIQLRQDGFSEAEALKLAAVLDHCDQSTGGGKHIAARIGSEVATQSRERRSIWRIGPESTWTTIVPVVFIIASLGALAVLPLIFSAHTAQMRREITKIAEPARRA